MWRHYFAHAKWSYESYVNKLQVYPHRCWIQSVGRFFISTRRTTRFRRFRFGRRSPACRLHVFRAVTKWIFNFSSVRTPPYIYLDDNVTPCGVDAICTCERCTSLNTLRVCYCRTISFYLIHRLVLITWCLC